jgi:hypothetical protein
MPQPQASLHLIATANKLLFYRVLLFINRKNAGGLVYRPGIKAFVAGGANALHYGAVAHVYGNGLFGIYFFCGLVVYQLFRFKCFALGVGSHYIFAEGYGVFFWSRMAYSEVMVPFSLRLSS